LLVGESLLDGGVAVLAMLTLVRTRLLCRRSPLPGDDDPITGRAVNQVGRSLHLNFVVDGRVAARGCGDGRGPLRCNSWVATGRDAAP
jgi:hypothetical protein